MSTSHRLLATDESLAPDVLRFCAEHDLLPLVHEALRLAEATLQPVGRPVIELEVDP